MRRSDFVGSLAAGLVGLGCDWDLRGRPDAGSGTAAQDPQALLDAGGAVFNVRHPAFGARGDGTDETAALRRALAAAGQAGGGVVLVPAGEYRFAAELEIPAGVCLQGVGAATVLIPENRDGNTIRVSGSGAAVLDLRIAGSTPGGIRIQDGASDVTVRRIHFRGIGQCVWLWTCSRVTVENCSFEGTGYGVIQQKGHVSDGVRVSACTIWDAGRDFIAANCTAEAPSRGWIIEGNRYLGHAAYEHRNRLQDPENRFVGITAVEGVIIAGNYCTRSGGDAPIHLEDTYGEILIIGNVIQDCHTSGGNNGYIYLLHSDKHSLVANNIIKHTDLEHLGSGAFAISARSGSFDHDLLIQGNRFVAPQGGFGGLDLRSNHGSMLIAANQFVGLDIGIAANQTSNVQVANNTFAACHLGIAADPRGPSGGSCDDWSIAGNVFRRMGGASILVRRNSSGTGPSSRWLVSGNRFDGDALGYDTIDFAAFGNAVRAGARIDLGGRQFTGSQNYIERDNIRFT